MEEQKYFEYEHHVKPGSKFLGLTMQGFSEYMFQKFNRKVIVILGNLDEGLVSRLKDNKKDALFIDHIHNGTPSIDNRQKPHRKEKTKTNYHLKFISTSHNVIDYIKNYHA